METTTIIIIAIVLVHFLIAFGYMLYKVMGPKKDDKKPLETEKK